MTAALSSETPRHEFEVRHVTMPAQRRPETVLRNQHVRERFGSDAHPSSHLGPQRMKRGRQWRRGIEAIGIEVAVAAEADAAPPRNVALVAHVFEWQRLNEGEQVLLFGATQKPRIIGQPSMLEAGPVPKSSSWIMEQQSGPTGPRTRRTSPFFPVRLTNEQKAANGAVERRSRLAGDAFLRTAADGRAILAASLAKRWPGCFLRRTSEDRHIQRQRYQRPPAAPAGVAG